MLVNRILFPEHLRLFLSVPFSGDSFSVLFESFSFRAVSGDSLPSLPCHVRDTLFFFVPFENFSPIQLTGDSLSVPVEGDPHSVSFECFSFRVVFRKLSFCASEPFLRGILCPYKKVY